MKPIILFDFDSTLFNVSALKVAIYHNLAKKLNLSNEEFKQKKDKYVASLSDQNFVPKTFVEHISQRENVDELVNEIFQTNVDYSEYLYPESLEILQQLSKSYTLGIFSEGDPDWQMEKIVKTKILSYFDQEYVFVHQNKTTKEALDLLPEGSFIIDDKPKIIEKLSTKTNITPIWLQRHNHDKPLVDSITIHSLTEIPSLLEKIIRT
jgi:FMN phosphatase YigB (HAD superfamily)